ncbi:hypothetical protein JHK85_002005 [Glycine max]|nr:hypothetical protein JHK85_002005 [Glycine max]KAG5089339.1 hypothetical protein JHK86_001951 [Glycine max]
MNLDTIFAFTLAYILLVITSSEFPSVAGDDVSSVISGSLFEQLLQHRNDIKLVRGRDSIATMLFSPQLDPLLYGFADVAANRVPGYGVITNIINGGIECGNGPTLGSEFPSVAADDVSSIISASQFEQLLKHRNDQICEGKNGFYSYNAFVTAARTFDGFGTTGDVNTRKREVAAFLAQTSHETTGGGGWPNAPDGPYAWGYCFVTERDKSNNYCEISKAPCASGKSYYGRGPLQLTHNYNYDLAGKAIHSDLINNPDLVAQDPVVSFQTAIWFWMTSQANKPSCHDVITNRWTPSSVDMAANRAPGYGVITNIINGRIECGNGPSPASNDRIGFYKKYCEIFGLSDATNLDCSSQKSFDQD